MGQSLRHSLANSWLLCGSTTDEAFAAVPVLDTVLHRTLPESAAVPAHAGVLLDMLPLLPLVNCAMLVC